MKESEIQRDILDFLEKCEGHFWRNFTGPILRAGRKTPNPARGTADILGLLPSGRFVAIEVKTETGRLSVDQRKFEKLVKANDGIFIVARSVLDVEKILG